MPKALFKVGDRVRRARHPISGMPLGHEGVITRVNGYGDIKIDRNNDWYFEQYFELVKVGPPSMLINCDASSLLVGDILEDGREVINSSKMATNEYRFLFKNILDWYVYQPNFLFKNVTRIKTIQVSLREDDIEAFFAWRILGRNTAPWIYRFSEEFSRYVMPPR